jgi:hypothetical protein
MKFLFGRSAAPIAAVVMVAALVVATCATGPGTATGRPDPAPTKSQPIAASNGPSTAVDDDTPPPSTHVSTPFEQPGSDACFVPPQPECIDSTDDDSIRVTFTVPDGWAPGADGIELATLGNAAPAGAGVLFIRGASLFDDPCRNDGIPEIPVGPTVDNFADAIAAHPLLDVTAPTVTALAGYTGKYVDLQVPLDPTIQGSSEPASLDGCPIYRPWEPWFLAQGPGQRWHLWILDVGGVRVVVQAMDYAGTSAQHRTELQAIVDSIQIKP